MRRSILLALPLLLVSTLAHAADKAADCKNPDWAPPPIPGYSITGCEERAWDSVPIPLPGSKPLVVEGWRSFVSFGVDKGAQRVEPDVVGQHYGDALKKAGFEQKLAGGRVVFHRTGAEGEWWYVAEGTGGSAHALSTYALRTFHVAPLAQEVEARAMSGDLDLDAPCGDPPWIVKTFDYYRRTSCSSWMWDDETDRLSAGSQEIHGRHRRARYTLSDESRAPVPRAVHLNFVRALQKSGAEILLGEKELSGPVIARQKGDKGDYWMMVDGGGGSADHATGFDLETWQEAPLQQFVEAKALDGAIDTSGCHDPEWQVKGYPDYARDRCRSRDFDTVEIVAKDGKKKLAGRVEEVLYKLSNENHDVAPSAICTNYVEALKKTGAELASDPKQAASGAYAALVKKTADGETWFVWAHSGNEHSTSVYTLTTLQVGGPPPKSCTMEVYGVNFDFDKATLRPDSEPVLQAVLALFQKDATMKAEIGGHTDDVGQAAHNQTLSEQRAAAVKAWLVAHGIAADRMTTHGYGDTKPLVPNKDDESRAKNRRVELTRENCTAAK